jgi:site-specific DNA-methyltransferase (adenine-specific)
MLTLHQGDCLKIIPHFVPDESVDLVYIDPPFYTGHNFDTFTDKWLSMDTYVRWLAMRLRECYDAMAPTSSIYVHLDWHAVHYVKVEMDKIFGMDNFRNEIAWCYRKWSVAQSQFARNHDTILFYTKSDKNTFNTLHVPLSESTLKRWKGKKQNKTAGTDGKLVDAGASGKSEGSAMPDWWEVPVIAPVAKERLGYPTQKPEALLERIIKASSNPGDLILDPMCGCGTALVVANKLERRYVGIDLSEEAINLSARRLSSCQKEL